MNERNRGICELITLKQLSKWRPSAMLLILRKNKSLIVKPIFKDYLNKGQLFVLP